MTHSVLIVLWIFTVPLHAAELCPAADIGSLQLALKDKAAAEVNFFASWCASCKKHLSAATSSDVFIAVFDEKAAAEKVVAHVAREPLPRCFWDQDGSIAKAYDVKGLPAQRPAEISPRQ